jgi:hypothetical protein
MTQGTPEPKLNMNETPDRGRLEWERPALRRLAASEAGSKEGTKGVDGNSSSGS